MVEALHAKLGTLSLEAQSKLEKDTAKKEAKAEARAEGIKVKDWILTHPEPKRGDPLYCHVSKTPQPNIQQFLDEDSEGEWEYEEEEEGGKTSDQTKGRHEMGEAHPCEEREETHIKGLWIYKAS